jgi:hypothetical protein
LERLKDTISSYAPALLTCWGFYNTSYRYIFCSFSTDILARNLRKSFKVSLLFWLFYTFYSPIPGFTDSRFYKFRVLQIPAFLISGFLVPHSIPQFPIPCFTDSQTHIHQNKLIRILYRKHLIYTRVFSPDSYFFGYEVPANFSGLKSSRVRLSLVIISYWIHVH